MGDKESTVRARELGAALRKALRAGGLENKQVARRLGWSPSKVSNMLGARRGVTEADVASVLAICGIGGAERERLLRLAREAHERSWLQEHGDRLQPKLFTLMDHEESTVSVTDFEISAIPGLLQTGPYASALLRTSATIPADEVEYRVDARLQRQEILGRYRLPLYRCFIDELALRRTGPGPEIMSDQLHHLLRMSVRPNIDIRVIPDAVGFHAGQRPFHFMEFTEIAPVVHVENETSVVFEEGKATVGAYRKVIGKVAATALDREESRRWISTLATELSER